MKKIFPLIFTFLFLLFSCSETVNPPINENMDAYMPLSIGNYWVYEVYDSITNKSYIDSMVVVAETTVENIKAYVVHNYRNNVIRDKGYYSGFDDKIMLYGKVLMPLLWTPDEVCFSKQTKRWFPFLSNRKESNCVDSVLGNFYTTLVKDSTVPGGFRIVESKTAFILRLNGKIKEINSSNWIGSNQKEMEVEFDGTRVMRILEPAEVQFTIVEGMEYFDNNRAVISNKLNLKIRFAKEIGITETTENAEGEWKYHQTRKLLRYQIN